MDFPIFDAIRLPDYFFSGIDPEILIRMGLSAVAGTLIGIERERHGRAAGLRTQLLVCLASCIAMILSDGFYEQSYERQDGAGGWHPDPARLAAGVLAGMGFLGAGVILRQSTHVIRGVTTAATLWFVTIIGMAFGSGAVGIGVIATVIALLILCLFPYLESSIKNDWYSDLGVWFAPSLCSMEKIVKALGPLGVKVKGIDVEEDFANDLCHVTLHLRYKRKSMVTFTDEITRTVRKVEGVGRISWRS